MWRRVIVFILLLIGVGYVQAQEGIVILDVVEGDIQYARLGWQSAQDLLPGTIVTTTDLMYPQDSTLLVLCSNGNTQVFFPADLRPDQPLQCPQEDSVVPVPGRRTLRVQRGAQHPTAPYVMSPRSTALRDEQLTVRWNALINVLNYTITVREANDIFWTSDLLTPQQVENENIAQWTLPEDHPLIPDIAYTIEICVTFMNTQQGCTTDPGWNTGINNAFYYVPDEALDDRIDNLSDTLQTPQLLYAQAVLLMQPIDSLSVDGMPIAYYAEAIDKLTQLQADYPDHVLATSPILSNILGELYRKVGLT
ncbi:MAG: hypothetical protein KC615_04415, partial [Anaerolineae bacterium]|nr:hypothetical protein [Anaerolineae bacterium]